MRAMSPPDVLRVEGLVKRYGRKRALDGISFSARRGDVFGFLGPNGAGKTTTIRIVLGLIRATAGKVFLFGEERRGAALSAMARLGAMVEIPRFYGHLSGRRSLEVLATLSGAPRGTVGGSLDVVRLAEAADAPVATYSQGMRQRLGIAQALLADPELVILDEPTNGLDPHGVHEMRELIVRLNRERGLTFLISSHQLTEIEQIANRVAILRKGRLLVHGPVGEILAGRSAGCRIVVDDAEAALSAVGDAAPAEIVTGSLRVRTERDGVPALVERLVGAGVRVHEVVPERPTLEDYFLEVTEGEKVDLGQ